MKLAGKKVSKYNAEVTPMVGMLPISSHNNIDPFCKLQSFREWDKEMDIHRDDETSSTTQY